MQNIMGENLLSVKYMQNMMGESLISVKYMQNMMGESLISNRISAYISNGIFTYILQGYNLI